MDPRDFLDVAEILLENYGTPATCRTVIGRSYYAAFNVAVSLLEELNIPLERQKDSHVEVLDLIAIPSKDPHLKTACDSIASLKKIRKLADYNMNDSGPDSVQKASRSMLVAEQAIKLLDQVHSDPAQWKAASDNMVDHARNVLRKVF